MPRKYQEITSPSVRQPSVVISEPWPCIDGGRHPAKRVPGEIFRFEADIFKDGHEQLAAVLQWKPNGKKAWRETPLTPTENDRWGASITFDEPGAYRITVEAWADDFLTWLHDFELRLTGDQPSFDTELTEGRKILFGAADRAADAKALGDAEAINDLASRLKTLEPGEVPGIFHTPEVLALMARWQNRSLSTRMKPSLPVLVERPRARFSAWYEFFPRSAEGRAGKPSTFRDCLGRLDDACDMGFDVIYLPPIHPIGITFRKGKNNSLDAGKDDVGSPWAIGGPAGGHREVEPALGTIADFDWFVRETRKRGMEVALDFAINCSPDHPWVKKHPEWFFHRPDGSIKYAENPPKKYQDIYPINFHCEDWQGLWKELCEVVLFWVKKGVRIFRVDNPHTKPVAFWKWLIEEVRNTAPDTLFLAEAFTRPKMMHALGKIGFSQSYTYFTWRVNKHELTEYVRELTRSNMREYYRGNFWPNTPDILPYHLQGAPASAFKVRATLAATMMPSWGIYSGYELCENEPLPGREEYLDSEKYQLKERNWNKPGNIKGFIRRLNHIRKAQPALQEYANIEFIHSENDHVIAYYKWNDDRSNVIIVIVNLDPHLTQVSTVYIPLDALGLADGQPYEVEDLVYNELYDWKGSGNYVSLDPRVKPLHILKLNR